MYGIINIIQTGSNALFSWFIPYTVHSSPPSFRTPPSLLYERRGILPIPKRDSITRALHLALLHLRRSVTDSLFSLSLLSSFELKLVETRTEEEAIDSLFCSLYSSPSSICSSSLVDWLNLKLGRKRIRSALLCSLYSSPSFIYSSSSSNDMTMKQTPAAARN